MSSSEVLTDKKTLVSFLGKGYKDKEKGYRSTNYQFSDGTLFENSKYFGITLTQKIKPNKVIIFGTPSSIWDVFLEDGADNSEQALKNWFELSEAVKKGTVTRELLKDFDGFLSKKLNATTECHLIDFAKDEIGQVKILSTLNNLLDNDDKVVIDVTHSFRHLPMISLVASRFLKRTKNVEVTQIYYGALEMSEDKKTPVIELKGLLDMLDWVSAIETFDKDGDYAVFAPLLQNVGLDENSAKELEKASFLERVMNATDASQKLKQIMPKLEQLKNNSPMFELFYEPLQTRLSWFKKSSRGLQEQDLAKKYLKRQDYVRAVIYAMEGLISRETSINNKNVNKFDDREKFYKELRSNEQFRTFKEFRNAMVHGTASGRKNIRNIMKDEQSLANSLKSRFNNLF